MATKSERRQQLRPQGLPSPGCDGCQFQKLCGGYFSGKLFGTCFDDLCCHFTRKSKDTCNAICPYKGDFADWLIDTRGMRFDDLPEIPQCPIDLPLYIPLIEHASSRREPLRWPVVALNTYKVLGTRRSGKYRALATDPASLRQTYLLDDNARVVLRGVGKDPELESYWENRLHADAPAQLAKLNITAAIGPNFSHFLDVPRTDHLYNKRRQMVCLQELAARGIPVVSHLNSISPGDWVFWTKFLTTNAQIGVVAIEFQTGHKTQREGRKVLNHLAATQKELGRPLHLILVGGAQFLEYAAVRFCRITLIDSTPFHKTRSRAIFDEGKSKSHWVEGMTLYGQKLDDLLLSNIMAYDSWLSRRARNARQATAVLT